MFVYYQTEYQRKTDLGGLNGAKMCPPRRMGRAATALATIAAFLADDGVRMASAGDSGALAACLGNRSLIVFHSTVLMQMGAPAINDGAC